MWLKENIKELLTILFGLAFIIFTATGIIPIDVFTPIAIALVMFFFEEKSKDKLKAEIAQLKEHLKGGE